MKPSPFEELAQRILEAQQRPRAIDDFLSAVYGIDAPGTINIRELEPGVVYGPPQILTDDCRFAFAVASFGEISIDP